MSKILLVEDDNNLREIYEARLQAEGYEIVSARDGEEALVVAKAEHPDLVISDVMMPKISGFEMLDILRNTDGLKDVKVIMLTALGQAEDQTRADKLGADRYLVKSQVTLEDIVKVSQQLLNEAGGSGAAAAPAATPTAAPAATPAPPPATPTPPAPTPAPPAPTPTIPVATPPADTPAAPAIPVPEPAPATTTPMAAEPETSKQEEATVKQQIEEFVKDQPATPAPVVTASADQDKAMSDAVDTLVASTEPAPVPKPAPSPDLSTMPERKIQSAPTTPQPPDETAPTEEEVPARDSLGDSAPVARKKVIKPLDNPGTPTKSLDQLLAEEASKSAQTVPGNQITPATPPATPPATTPGAAADFDPNSIAL